MDYVLQVNGHGVTWWRLITLITMVTAFNIDSDKYCMKCTCGKTLQDACNINNNCYMG